MKALVTGGAGFIGSHIVDELLAEGLEVRVLDRLDPQVHGEAQLPPGYLSPEAELRIGDVRDPDAVDRALEGIDIVFHEAAAVGVGQSMYEIDRYVSTNSMGAAVLLQGIVKRRERIQKIVVASSMSIYGEGAYRDMDGNVVSPPTRSIEQLRLKDWELKDAHGRHLTPVPTPETKETRPASVYAVTKRDHEDLFLVVGEAYGIPAVALRYFNTYGPRQALSNPYTGLLSIVCSQINNGNRPLVFEDGLQTRDFVHVSDVARANILAMKSAKTGSEVYNVGTGWPVTVLDVIGLLSEKMNFRERPEIVERYRAGDIRHCYADISKIQRELGYQPRKTLETGVDELIPWIKSEESVDHIRSAVIDLERRVLIY